jgi:hypothetical protein
MPPAYTVRQIYESRHHDTIVPIDALNFALSTSKLGSVGKALLDFATIDDLQDWLKSHKSRRSPQS